MKKQKNYKEEKIIRKIRDFDMAGDKYILGSGILVDGNLKDDLIKYIKTIK